MKKKIFSRVRPSNRSWLRILLKIWKVFCSDLDFSITSSSQKAITLCLHLHGDLVAWKSLAELKLKVRHQQLIHSGTNQPAVIWNTYKQIAWGHHLYLQNCAALKVIRVSEAKCLSQWSKGQQKFYLSHCFWGPWSQVFVLFFFFYICLL